MIDANHVSPRCTKPAPPAEQLKALRALVLDCDGVLTPGDLFYDEDGKRLLRFDAHDGFALAALCGRAGLKVGVLSGRPTDIAEKRLRELGVNEFFGECRDKAAGLEQLCQRFGVAPRACAYVGDDLPDLRAFARAGLRIAVANAAVELVEVADWVTLRSGGKGAVREVCEAILKARGDWHQMLETLRSP